MLAQTQIRKPENWQDFEKLCKKLWGEIWNCTESIKRNGRSGQNQSGVDIYGLPKNEDGYFGIQCKGKDDYSQSKLSQKEIDNEIEKALTFMPPLKSFIFTTTADKDVKIEEYVRQKNIENIQNGLFSIDIFSWSDIVDLLESHRQSYNWFINNCQYKDSSDVDINIGGKKEFVISPQYKRTSKIYCQRTIPANNSLFALSQRISSMNLDHSRLSTFNGLFFPKKKIDYSWCTIPITIINTGSTVIEDYKVSMIFDMFKIEELNDKYQPFNPGPLIDQSVVASVNKERKEQREVFESSELYYIIDIRPINPILVQGEHRIFKIGVKPKIEATDIQVKWKLISRDFMKEGDLFLRIEPTFEDIKDYIQVDDPSEIKEKEIIIERKIVEQ